MPQGGAGVKLVGPVRYAGICRTGPSLGRVPLPPEKVYVVRGRTASRVYHTDPHCPKLCPEQGNRNGIRYAPKIVNKKAAEDSGKRICSHCDKPQQRWITDYVQPHATVIA